MDTFHKDYEKSTKDTFILRYFLTVTASAVAEVGKLPDYVHLLIKSLDHQEMYLFSNVSFGYHPNKTSNSRNINQRFCATNNKQCST